MSVVNTYEPPTQPTAETIDVYGPDPYDINFVLNLDLFKLQSDKVKLVHFVPRLHTDTVLAAVQGRSELFRYLPFDMTQRAHFAFMTEHVWRPDSGRIMLTILDTTREGSPVAGLIGLSKTDMHNLCAEIAPFIVLPEFTGTHVGRHATALLTRYVMDLPSDGGLGFRRLQWATHPDNIASIKSGQRIGMKVEGVLRWTWITPHEGDTPRAGDTNRGNGRHSTILAVCCDDWENGARDKVQQLLAM